MGHILSFESLHLSWHFVSRVSFVLRAEDVGFTGRPIFYICFNYKDLANYIISSYKYKTNRIANKTNTFY